ncbi:hypothetical protein BSPWISOXPB_11395, partial [uncultured Gammaproteobacteria bacterium]
SVLIPISNPLQYPELQQIQLCNEQSAEIHRSERLLWNPFKAVAKAWRSVWRGIKNTADKLHLSLFYLSQD